MPEKAPAEKAPLVRAAGSDRIRVGLIGAGPRGQVLAAVVCATIPEGLLAASGAKGDWVLSLWLTALALGAFRFAGDPSGMSAVRIGGALGLACLTKGTAYALAPPFLLALAVLSPRRIKGELLRRLPLIALVAFAVVVQRALVHGLAADHQAAAQALVQFVQGHASSPTLPCGERSTFTSKR